MSAASSSSPFSVIPAAKETRHAMKLRHKAELKTLMAAPTKGIGAKKKQKDDAAALEIAQAAQLAELEKKEQAEKAAEENGAEATPAAAASATSTTIVDDDEEESAHAASPTNVASSSTSSSSARVPSRAQKKKAAAAAKAAARTAELREMTKDMKDERAEEDKQIKKHMEKEEKKLRVCEMVSDGHCLYRAVADQAMRHGLQRDLPLDDNRPPFIGLRQLAARYIDQHRDDFAAFMALEDENGKEITLDDAAWKKYLADLVSEDLAVWGGHNEVVALSKVLKRPIIIWSADGRMEVGEEFRAPAAAPAQPSPTSSPSSPSPDPEPLHISFHQHYFGLGAHYNSVITDAEADEDEAFASSSPPAAAAQQC